MINELEKDVDGSCCGLIRHRTDICLRDRGKPREISSQHSVQESVALNFTASQTCSIPSFIYDAEWRL